jgi:thiamine biosynthesis protein ThiC
MEYTRKCYKDVPHGILLKFKDDTNIEADCVKNIHITEYASGNVCIDAKICFSHDVIEENFNHKKAIDIGFDLNASEVNVNTGDSVEKEDYRTFLDMYIYSIGYGAEMDGVAEIDLSFRKIGF